MKWLKRISVVALGLLALAIAAVYLTPLDTYIPELERVLGRQLQDPVSIRHLRINALPLPHVELQEVYIGGKEGIAARSVRLEPDLPALLAGEIIVRRILVQDGTANPAQVRKLASLFGGTPYTARDVSVRELQLAGMSLSMPAMTVGPIEGKLEFAPAGGLERAWFAMDEQKMTAVLSPLPGAHFSVKAQARAWSPPQLPEFLLDDLQVEGVLGEREFVARQFAISLRGVRMAGSGRVEFSDGWHIQAELSQADAPVEKVLELLGRATDLSGAVSVKGTLSGKAETLSALKDNFRFSGNVLVKNARARISPEMGHPLLFDQIVAHVVARPDRLELGALEAKLYGGKLSGTASVSRKHSMLVADIAASGIDMQPLVKALANDVLFTGRLDGSAKLSMQLDAFERFPENLQLSANFHLRNGVISKIDLAQAAGGSGKTDAAKGSTRFDDLAGLLTVDASGYHFRKLKIASGSLNAEGKLDISPSLKLGGTLDTNIKGTAGLVSMPLVVTGTLNDPVVRPSGSALAGAAVGTAILGPGLGTAIGAKVGGFLNKLFGRKDDEKGTNKEEASRLPATK